MPPSILTFANQKGGVGKTTSTINLGGCLAAQKKRTLLIDIDPQGNCGSGLGINVHNLEKSMYDVFLEERSLSEIVLPTAYDNLFIAPANVDLSGIEIDLLQRENRERILKAAVHSISNHYDYILIDAPPSLGILTLNALCASSGVIVTLQTEYYALEGLSQLLKVIRLIQKSLNPILELTGVLLTMYDSRTSLSQQVAQDARDHFPDRVFKTVIPRNVKLSEAPSFSKLIVDYASESQGALAYQELAQEILAEDYAISNMTYE